MKEVDVHSVHLNDVADAVDAVKLDFDKAVEGTVRIGSRLAITEGEEQRIDKATELLNYILYFQNADSEMYTNVMDLPIVQIKQVGLHLSRLQLIVLIFFMQLLPPELRHQDWGFISRILHDLKEILAELNTDDVSQAMHAVFSISQSVENELLGQFDLSLNRLMGNVADKSIIKICNDLAQWLHLFNGGRSIQQKYVGQITELYFFT